MVDLKDRARATEHEIGTFLWGLAGGDNPTQAQAILNSSLNQEAVEAFTPPEVTPEAPALPVAIVPVQDPTSLLAVG